MLSNEPIGVDLVESGTFNVCERGGGRMGGWGRGKDSRAFMGGKSFDVSPSNKNGNTWHPSVSETADVTLAREGTG